MEVLRRTDYLIKRVFSERNRPTFLHYRASQSREPPSSNQASLAACETKPHVFTCIKRIVISVHLNSVFFYFVY